MPGFHPDKQQRNPQGADIQVVTGISVPAHIRPKIQQTQYKRETADIIAQQQGKGRQSQEMNGFFQNMNGVFAMSTKGGFHDINLKRMS
jgi:hypothetical protein